MQLKCEAIKSRSKVVVRISQYQWLFRWKGIDVGDAKSVRQIIIGLNTHKPSPVVEATVPSLQLQVVVDRSCQLA